MIRTRAAALLFIVLAVPALALDLPSSARLVDEQIRAPGSHEVATGPFNGERVPTQSFEGAVIRQVWRVERGGASLAIVAMLRGQLTEAGYDIVFECAADACGGFDFRFGIEVARPPAMIVNLRNYRYLAMRNTSADAVVTALVSRSQGVGYLQLVSVTPTLEASVLSRDPGEDAPPAEAAPRPMAEPSLDIAERLLSHGHVDLHDLEFETGSTALGAGDFPSLEKLAEFLRSDPARRVILVGHTDSVGALDSNISLSRRRAEAVRQRLLARHGVDAAALSFEGVGYLAPQASNRTKEGRQRNRRVEAVLLSAE